MVYAADKFLRKFLGLSRLGNNSLFANAEYEDPTYPLFHIQFIFGPSLPDAKHPDFVANRLLDSEENPESAISYLKSISEPERATNLSNFIVALRSISQDTPYYFQGLSGVDNLMKMHYPADSKTPFSEQQDVILTIKTLESIDFKILALKDLYNKSAFDRRYRRWMLPINLRRFRMRIMIGEYRQMAITEENFSVNPRQLMDTLKDIDILNASNVGGKLLGRVSEGNLGFVKRLQWWDNHFSCLVFDCHDCEFEMMSAPPELANLSQDQSVRTQLSNTFGIRVGRVTNTNVYSLLKYVLSDNMLFQSFLRMKKQSLSDSQEQSYSQILKSLTKENPDEKTAILSKQYQNIFKPVYPSWSSYQNLLREKGDNKRVILENRDFESAVSAGLNEGLNAIGIGNALGNGTNFGPGLGSVGNFVGDTISGLAQEALGMATEQVAQNVFDNALYNSIAGTALGVLNGDLNAVARSFTNPALAGALGINLETSGRPVPPNLRDGIPTNVGLTAPTVQRSLSDFRANLTGEGADPRFQSIGRPGQSLFSNPGAVDKVMQPENVDFDEIRKETQFSASNVEFTEVKKETQLNPQKETLIGANPKRTLDETNASLTGAQPVTTLSPTNADLTGAQALKDLTPSNADLTGAQALKDLTPSNADLNGAQPLKDLTPSNADLTGAQALKDLTPSNADLTGAQALKDLTPSNADLTGAQALKDLTPSNADLTGAQAVRDLTESNANLTGVQALRDLNSSNVDLTGVQSLTELNPSNVDFTGAQAINSLSQSNADLTGAQALRTFTESNANLESPSVQRNFTESNADLIGSPASSSFDTINVKLEGNQPSTSFESSNVDLTGISTQNISNLGNEELQGRNPLRSFNETNVGNMSSDYQAPSSLGTENLIGSTPIKSFDSSNVDLTISDSSPSLQSNVELSGYRPEIRSKLGVEELNGAKPMTNMSMINSELTGAKSGSAPFGSKNVDLTGAETQSTINGKEALVGAGKLTNMNVKNVNLTSAKSNREFNSPNLGLQGFSATVNTNQNVEFVSTSSKETMEIQTIELEGRMGETDVPTTNINLTGPSKSESFHTKNILGIQPSKPE